MSDDTPDVPPPPLEAPPGLPLETPYATAPPRPKRTGPTGGVIVVAVLAVALLIGGAVVAWFGVAARQSADDDRAVARTDFEAARHELSRARADLAAAEAAVLTFSDSARQATAASARIVELERALVDRLGRLRAAGSAGDAGAHNRIVDELQGSSDGLVDAFTDLDGPLLDFSHALEGLPTARCTGPAAATARWTPYGSSGLECARLLVPLDYADPEGEQIELMIVRRPADDPATSLGPLLLNPGGPGGSGVAFLREATLLLPPEVLQRFDLVAWDPRGVGHSTPVDCADDLDPLFTMDLTAESPRARDAAVTRVARLLRGCAERSGDLLRHVDTYSSAHDMDRIRRGLDVDKLSYLGFSYGTYLGAVYADLFPEHVRAAVLDGAVHPARASEGAAVADPGGFADALETALDDCANNPMCEFYSLGQPAQNFDPLMEYISAVALKAGHDRVGRTQAELGVVSGLYAGADGWPELMHALGRAAVGDGVPLKALSDRYTGRRPDGSYNNEMEAHYAINCTDLGGRLTPREARRAVRRLSTNPGRFEAVSVMLALPCAFWPAPRVELPADPPDGNGAPPILVIGGEGDPATPIEGAEALAETLDSGTLLRFEGSGHTAFGRGSDCIDDAVVTYLVTLETPPDGKACPAE